MDVFNKFGARNVFRGNGKTHAGDTQTLWQRGFARKLVRELAIFRQQLRVGARRTRSMVVPVQGTKTVAGTLMVQFFKDTFFSRRNSRSGLDCARGSQQENKNAIKAGLHSAVSGSFIDYIQLTDKKPPPPRTWRTLWRRQSAGKHRC